MKYKKGTRVRLPDYMQQLAGVTTPAWGTVVEVGRRNVKVAWDDADAGWASMERVTTRKVSR